MIGMRYRPVSHSMSPFSLFIFIIFAVSILFFFGYQCYKNVYAVNGDYQKPHFDFISEQNSPCTENLSEGQTFMNENRCSQICPTDPSSIIPEGCVQQPQQQPEGEDQSIQDQQQQPQQQPEGEDQSIQDQQQQPQQQPEGEDQSIQDQQQQPQQQPEGEDQSIQDQQQQPQQQPEGDFTIPNDASTNTFTNTLKGGPIIAPNLHFPETTECFNDITGKWIGNDGGNYYIRENGVEIWWFGFNTNTIGKGFSNVFYGTTNGTENPRIYGQWQDVPLGETRANGNLGLLIDPTGTKITKFWSLGDYFGGSEWTRANDCSRISSGSITGSDGGLVLKH